MSQATRRRVKVRLSAGQLSTLLGVPSDVGIAAVYGTSDPPSVTIVLHGDRFEEVQDDCEAPFAPQHWSSVVADVGGKKFVRFEWDDAREPVSV